MKVLFFCNLAPRKTGSFEALLIALARQFQAVGDEIVYVFCDDPIPEVAEGMREAGCAMRVIQGWAEGQRVRPWRFVLPAFRLLREERPDVAVVHFGNELPSLVVSLLSGMLGLRPRWVWQQDQQIQPPGVLASHVSRLRLLVPVFRHFVAVYDGGQRSIERRGIPKDRISVVYNSAPDRGRLREPGWLRGECRMPKESCVCVTVSSLIPRKRVDAVLCAFSEVRSSPSPHLVVVGDGADRADLERMAGSLGVSERVHFLGLRNDVREILLEANMLVHAATAEACSYAIIESMASGIPAVVTDSGAAREQIMNGDSGYVVGRDDLEGLADRLEELIGDGDLRKQMGAKARARWQEHYRAEVAAAKYHDLYRSLVGGTEVGGRGRFPSDFEFKRRCTWGSTGMAISGGSAAPPTGDKKAKLSRWIALQLQTAGPRSLRGIARGLG